MRRKYSTRRKYSPLPNDPEESVPHVEVYFPNLNSIALKQIARLFVGKASNTMNKEACFNLVSKSYGDPALLRQMAKNLSDFERAGLGLVKLRGGKTAYTLELAIELLMLGYPYKEKSKIYYSYSDDSSKLDGINALIDHGLLMRFDGYAYSRSMDSYSYSPAVFADERVLAEIEPMPPRLLNIKPAGNFQPRHIRSRGETLLHLVALGQAIDKIGGIEVSVKGVLSKSSMAKLRKSLGWETDKKSLTPLNDPTFFYFCLWRAAHLFNFDEHRSLVAVDQKAASILERAFEEQAVFWTKAYRSMHHWIEREPEGLFYESQLTGHNSLNGLRSAVMTAMAALPDPNGWYCISDLSDAIFERLGKRFSLGHRSSVPRSYGKSNETLKTELDKWLTGVHKEWRKIEQTWIEDIFVGPLFHLGLVDLSSNSNNSKLAGPNLFRLTQAGRAAFYDIFRAKNQSDADAATAKSEGCWVVQPNFDVVVYLDGADPQQLGFIERVCERVKIDGAAALYRLTRESIYQALEAGVQAGALIRTLSESSRHTVPESVVRSLNDWARKRERISVHMIARIMEYGSSGLRDADLENGKVKGTPVGDRFLLVESVAKSSVVQSAINYLPAPPKCISLNEDGTIKIDPLQRDLLIDGELSRFCRPDPKEKNLWLIDGASVKAAIVRGWMAEGILDCLLSRSKGTIPPFLKKAIHAWSGKNSRTPPGSLAVSEAIVLQAEDLDSADAFAGSSLMKKYILSRLGPKAFLVKKEYVSKLKDLLKQFGFSVNKELLMQEDGSKKG